MGISRDWAAVAAAVFMASLFLPVAWAQDVSSTPQIREAVDGSHLVTLAGNTRPEAKTAGDRGAVADGFPVEHLLLQLKRSPAQEAALGQFIKNLSDPASDKFHAWLTPAEFGAKFGVAQADLDQVTSWLTAQGFTVNSVYPNRMVIDFSGHAGQIRTAFHTEIHALDVHGAGHLANDRDPAIPAALAPVVAGITSLHDFRPHTLVRPRANYTFTLDGSVFQGLVPADLATIYNINPLFDAEITGTGQTIVVIEDTNVYSTDDWTVFRSTFGLSGYTAGSFTQEHPPAVSGPNNCNDPGVNSDDVEAILDAEWASAAAPSAAIVLASCDGPGLIFGGLYAFQNIINADNPPPSISYGECEAQNGEAANATYYSAYQQAATEGVSVFVSSGDSGAALCDDGDPSNTAVSGISVNAFASTPFNVAVGGTDFGDTYAGTVSTYWGTAAQDGPTYGSAKSYIPEIPWNDSCASKLIAKYLTGPWPSHAPYGKRGFCNSPLGEAEFIDTAAGSGGPSACATGTPSITGVVSGTCAGNPKPDWQKGLVGNPNDGVRDLPDVSLFAANGVWGHFYIFCYSDTTIADNGGAPCTGAPFNWSLAGGTSFSSPIMAGIQALVNEKAGARQGNPNPVYYKMAAAEYGATGSTECKSNKGKKAGASCVFYDVTEGDIDVNCTGPYNCFTPSGVNGVLSTSNSAYKPAYTAGTGWDFATGIGTVNAYNLVMNWAP